MILRKGFRPLFLMILILASAPVLHGEPESPSRMSLVPAFPRLLFDRPVDFQISPDGSGRIFIVEQSGTVRLVRGRAEEAKISLFLDIKDRVDYDENEQGLLGLAFHPDFKTNGYFFVNYNAANPRRTVIARFKALPENPDQADPSSEQVILEIPQPYSNHKGGQLVFGPDGFLYIALGDGGSAGDPQGNGQSLGTLLGKILRIDVNRQEGGRPYAIPADNPFAGNNKGIQPEIYAYGLRNPWRFSFDESGRLWAADVGQDSYEEIDLIEKGKNYGWNIMEGSRCFSPALECRQEGLEMPVVDYDRELGRCVTGGFVYRGSLFPWLKGRYVYADFLSGRIWALQETEPGHFEPEEIARVDLHIASFGVDEDGELYTCMLDGGIFRLEPSAPPLS